MNRTATVSLLLAGGLILGGTAATVAVADLDGPGLAGLGTGAALGLLNLAVGWTISSRALRRGMKSAMGTLLGGFIVRLVLLCGLLLLFHRIPAIDEVAFALSFMVWFFVYVALEVVLVERASQRHRRAA